VGAEFVASAASFDQLPPAVLPEIAFAGRSNAGKSSAINALTARRGLAFVSKTPGRTQLVNLFRVPAGLMLVDLPGYGFSRVAADVRARWRPLLEQYLQRRSALLGVVLLMDIRHPLNPLDLQLIDWLGPARPVHVLLTKSDKLSRDEALRTLAKVNAALEDRRRGGAAPSVQLFSSSTRRGVAEVEAVLANWAGLPKESP
jgi:GTP-binding protein